MHADRLRAFANWPARSLFEIACLVLGAIAAMPSRGGESEEFAVFRLTDLRGSASLSSLGDRASVRSGDGLSASVSTQADTRAAASLSVLTRSYVYHPNLLSLDASFGGHLQRASFATQSEGTRSDTVGVKSLYDLSIRATVLRDKPYTAVLYYEHLNPSVSVGPALVILQENTRKGMQVSLLAPLTPVPLTLEVTRQRSLGSGSGRVLDDRTDRYALTAEAPIQRIGTSRLRLDGNKLDSQSGSVDLPIVRTASSTVSGGLDTRLHFGPDDRYGLTNLLTYAKLQYDLGQGTPADRTDARAYLDARARHSPHWQSYATLDAANTDQGAVRSRARSALAGTTWWPATNLASMFELRASRVDTREASSTDHGASASADIQFPLAGGRAQAGYAARYSVRSQQASEPTTPVVGERHLLNGVSYVALDRTHVVSGSLRVSNEPRTQIYIEGRDYLVSIVGTQSRIQRIVTGDITDGQPILADYSVETGGTFDSTQLDQTLNLHWSWSNRFSAYVRWLDSSPSLNSGAPQFALNAVRSATTGLHAEWPLGVLLTIGGNLEREVRRETVLPSRRSAADGFVQWEEAWLGPGHVRLATRRQHVNYDGQAQDVDLTGYDVHYRVYMASGLEVLAEWGTESDTGASVERRRDIGSLRARWRYRQLMMTLTATRVFEAQGALRTRRTLGQWLLQRDF